MERPLLAPMTFDSGWLLAMLERGDLLAMRAADGREIWRRRVGGGGSPLSRPIPGDGDALYMTFDNGWVVALSLADGTERWHQTLPGDLSAPAAAEDRVFVGSTDNFFYALDADDGEVAWKWRSGGDVIGAASDDDFVFFASLDNIIRGVNRGNGNQRWRKDTGTRPVGPPQAFGRLALVAGTSPTLAAFSARDGAPAGTYVAPGDLQGEPLVDPALKPFHVAAVIVMRDGQVQGLFPVAMQFREQLVTPLTALPGRMLQRERR
jgi:outer membrane protein assembly factor BamB